MSTTFILLQILSVFFCNFCLFPYYCNALHASRITHLPGFNGSLPFYLETGYVTVNEESGAELFYYFVESERNPSDDPLILFLVGGPYCSGFSGLALDVGPLGFMVKAYDGTLPTLTSNPFSWTQISSIIFLDWPVGTGFSFSPSIVDYHTDEVKSAKQIYKFLIKWLLDHPSFQSNPFYVAGDSYGGKMAPLSALEIADGNENFRQPFVNLKGYLVGNPVTSDRIDISSQPPHAYGLGIISDELLKGTVEEWHRCKQDSNNYTYNVPTSVPHHLNLIRRGYRALIYSGDHDLDIPFIGTLKWVRSLNFSIVENWRSWRAGGQVAGYTILFSNNLTFATVKGGSHTAPNNMPLQCFVMFERWISHKSL
ncbi:serine carboxypeptidase-like 6 isoform X3 [Phalaenopsis equestris]|uniref:serine carboxypeptidase-like 6 isoform X3 n=1 Tax=Phalaenopsis equestris TaxID=78828 RepID=UPI0009E3E047|nr:serine carboxypeptidase-like 6 isoform X3 [Phalaenopsis equestris]